MLVYLTFKCLYSNLVDSFYITEMLFLVNVTYIFIYSFFKSIRKLIQNYSEIMQTACTLIPSRFPVKPKPSSVVAFTFILLMSVLQS